LHAADANFNETTIGFLQQGRWSASFTFQKDTPVRQSRWQFGTMPRDFYMGFGSGPVPSGKSSTCARLRKTTAKRSTLSDRVDRIEL
jgi:hypothetical protein